MPGISRYSPIVSSIQPKVQLSTVAKDLPLGLGDVPADVEKGGAALLALSQ
jgi:hypothetical protein